jgi:hypothetical protein
MSELITAMIDGLKFNETEIRETVSLIQKVVVEYKKVTISLYDYFKIFIDDYYKNYKGVMKHSELSKSLGDLTKYTMYLAFLINYSEEFYSYNNKELALSCLEAGYTLNRRENTGLLKWINLLQEKEENSNFDYLVKRILLFHSDYMRFRLISYTLDELKKYL